MNAPDTEALARAFAACMLAHFDARTLRDIDRLNGTPKYEGCCASHDLCDANMVMLEAFETLTGRPLFGEDGMADADLAVLNAAWDKTRSTGFAAMAEGAEE